jgi:hypothetical protein
VYSARPASIETVQPLIAPISWGHAPGWIARFLRCVRGQLCTITEPFDLLSVCESSLRLTSKSAL